LKTEARDIDKGQLAQAVATAYGFDLQSIEFLPRGEDAYAFIVEGYNGAHHFVRAQNVGRSAQSESIYALVHTLHNKKNLTAAVAPYQTRTGSFTFSHGRYVVAVFPFILGRTLYIQGASTDDFSQAAGILSALHNTNAELEVQSIQRESFDNPFKDRILEALQTIDNPIRPRDELGRQLAQLLAAEREDVLNTLSGIEELAENARALASDWVLTHGDPNLDNWLKDAYGRLHITDWGELAIGPPERDLFAFTGAHFADFLGPYIGARSQVDLHSDIFAFYFYRWSLQEIADYTTRILFQDLGPTENEHAWVELQPYLPIPHEDIAQGVGAAQAVIDRVSAGQL